MNVKFLLIGMPIFVLQACGGSGKPLETEGLVVGSIYRNATVCFDTTGDGSCSDERVTVTTNDVGKFSIPTSYGDLIAEIGSGTVKYEPDTAATTNMSAATKATFRIHSSLIATSAVLSSISTQVSSEIDNGSTKDAALKKVAAAVGVDSTKLLANFNSESNLINKGLLQAYSDKMLAVVQSVVAAKSSSVTLKDAMKSVLTTPTSQQGTVQYAWTQIGATDTPFSKLEITGASSGSNAVTLATISTKANYSSTKYSDPSITATTSLQSTDSKLYAAGGLVARAIVVPDSSGNAACPKIAIDGILSTMTQRAAVANAKGSNGATYGSAASVDFNVLTCEASIASTAKSASINGTPLKLMPAKVNRVVVVGDTGCRLKGPTAFVQASDGTSTGGDPLQDCTDETAWPWAKIAKVAASFNPDLVIHNGDIHYREGFPAGTQKRWGGAANAANGGSEVNNDTVILPKFVAAKIDDSITYGWRAWEEDFFKSSGPLLAVAPWAITRGNHELCDRAGQGWFRFLDPRSFPAGEPEYDSSYVASSSYSNNASGKKYCSQYIDPVAMTVGDLQLVLLDVSMMNSSAGLSSSKGATFLDHIRVARQLTQVSALPDSSDASKISWIVSHKPFFAYSGGAAVATNASATSAGADTWQLQKAIATGTESMAFGNGLLPTNTQMTHAGHIHGFQMISHPTASGLPMNILMGTTGDNLEGLIEANTGTALAARGWSNNITSGAWPWFDQVFNGLTVSATKWYGNFAQYLPVNFSSSQLSGAGKKETAVMSEFSFLVIDRIGSTLNWTIKVYDKDRLLLRSCTTSGKSATCDG
ncbi:MAG: hypothetical protein EBS66_18420 [Betaproteobacteria bacterium]|nr:hypothetical protein [Betaproteobacteria bacterium]